MSPHVDILDEEEGIGRPLAASLLLHAGVVALLAVGAMIPGRSVEQWGERVSLGGATGVTPVASIPLPARGGVVNPVANPTKSQVPQEPPKPKAKEKAKVEKEPENAIPIKGRTSPKRASETRANVQRYRPDKEEKPNQVYSESGRALVSPLMGRPGVGGVGVGVGSPLGDRFGWYASLLQQLVASKWNTGEIDPRIRSAPPVIVTFTILRDGTIRNIQVRSSSGNLGLDRSAERALYDLGRAPKLPDAYDKNEANIEFWFELKR